MKTDYMKGLKMSNVTRGFPTGAKGIFDAIMEDVKTKTEKAMTEKKPSRVLTHTALAFLFLFITSIVIFTIYLAALGWPVFMDNLTANWLGVDNVRDLKLVLEFNADVQPLPMGKP